MNAGAPETQAETVVRLLEGGLAAKSGIEKPPQEREKPIDPGRIDIIRWVAGATHGIAAIVAAAVKLFQSRQAD